MLLIFCSPIFFSPIFFSPTFFSPTGHFGVAMMHGQLPQNVREQSLRDFKAGKVTILVTTDIAARGLDVEKLPFVVNFDMPRSIEVYVHRIGRTGRQGNIGVAETLFSPTVDRKLTKQLMNVLQSCTQQVPAELRALREEDQRQ